MDRTDEKAADLWPNPRLSAAVRAKSNRLIGLSFLAALLIAGGGPSFAAGSADHSVAIESEADPALAGEEAGFDYSFSGYKASEDPIPFVRTVETLEPLEWDEEEAGLMAYPQGPDSRARIQAAIDRVAALAPDESGFRGAVFLSKGTYYIDGGLQVKSGVVLRGEGQREFGTHLIFQNSDGVGITVGGEATGASAQGGLASLLGVEGLRLTSNYEKATPTETSTKRESSAANEAQPLRIGILVLRSENAWVRGCQVLHASEAAVLVADSRHVTVRDNLSSLFKGRSTTAAPFRSDNSSFILVYNCLEGDERQDFVVGEAARRSTTSPVDLAKVFARQLTARIGERPAALVLAESLSKASLPMQVVFPRPVIDGVVQGPPTPEQLAFEAANHRSWKTVMSDSGTKDWTKQWFLDGEGSTTVTNSTEGVELKAEEGHMVLWTKESFAGDLKIEYTFTRKDVDGEGVCIIYIQATGRGDAGYETDITKWNDYREDANMSKYFRNMHLYHVSYACGYVRGRRYNPEERKMNAYSELSPEYLVDEKDLFEPGVPYQITIIKTDREIRMRAVGPEKALYFKLDNERWAPISAGRIGLRQMQSRNSLYKDFTVSVPEK